MRKVYGIMAGFEEPEQLIEAARETRRHGFTKVDAYSPFPLEGLDEALGLRPSRVPLVFLLAGAAGALAAFSLQYYIARFDYPINVGGRPLNSWPAFIPITFELTVLFAGILGFIAVLAMNRLPMPFHPVFNSSSFVEHASQDRFYLCIEASDPKFDAESVKGFLHNLDPAEVHEIEE